MVVNKYWLKFYFITCEIEYLWADLNLNKIHNIWHGFKVGEMIGFTHIEYGKEHTYRYNILTNDTKHGFHVLCCQTSTIPVKYHRIKWRQSFYYKTPSG